MGVGKNIVALRKSMNLSQYALAQKAGISQSGLSTIESERNNATFPSLQAIATALGCTVTELVDGTTEKPTANGDGLDEALVNLLVDLSPAEVQRVKDFVAGLIAAREDGASPQG